MRNAILIFAGFAVLAFGMNFAANWLEMQPTPIDRKYMVLQTQPVTFTFYIVQND